MPLDRNAATLGSIQDDLVAISIFDVGVGTCGISISSSRAPAFRRLDVRRPMLHRSEAITVIPDVLIMLASPPIKAVDDISLVVVLVAVVSSRDELVVIP